MIALNDAPMGAAMFGVVLIIVLLAMVLISEIKK